MKRLSDTIIALLATLIFSPLLLFAAIGVRVFLGSPILFRQERPGKNERPFTLFKFRTMDDSIDDKGSPFPDEIRLTRFGSFLRRTSIDELPELFNVLRGDMSLVGPRPLLPEYLPLYNMRQVRRHDVRPGITGWAQINGRNAPTWSTRLEYDVWYVENRTLLLDFKILVATVATVIRSDGITEAGHATVRKFPGNE